MSKTDSKAAKDMTEAMEETMQRVQGRVHLQMKTVLYCVVDVAFSFTFTLNEMGTRIDDLEKNVTELMTQAGMEQQAISK
ncbi:heat shock factor-binding protein 1-like protein 1 [Lates japonicus]|uniref:Heat shock factor-binding protein 1-like protein 1 n=1 Tax=Lates japonicus TaxID=270547 RepID=A0AAD3R7H9_LATJO|nr:heat shock factor-binding protein 1-like protein 1 [Lates japonicus]